MQKNAICFVIICVLMQLRNLRGSQALAQQNLKGGYFEVFGIFLSFHLSLQHTERRIPFFVALLTPFCRAS
jgi:hypothetical protein